MMELCCRKEDAHIKRDIKDKFVFLNIWHHFTSIKFNNFGTQRLSGPWHLFHSFCCGAWCTFGPLYVYEPSFNTDNYGFKLVLKRCTKQTGTRYLYHARSLHKWLIKQHTRSGLVCLAIWLLSNPTLTLTFDYRGSGKICWAKLSWF